MRKPIIMNDGDTKPEGYYFSHCPTCKTNVFAPERSNGLWKFIANLFIHSGRITGMYRCPVCNRSIWRYEPKLKKEDQ